MSDRTARCPHCHKINSIATPGIDVPEDAVAKPGDVSICWNCGEPSIFTEFIDNRVCTAEELSVLLEDDNAMVAIAAIKARIKSKSRPTFSGW